MDEKDRYKLLKEWAEKNGKIVSMKSSISLDAMLRELPEYRNFIGNIMRNEALELGLTPAEMYDVIEVLDTSLNEGVYYFSLQFIIKEQERHQVTQSIVRELSFPIVSITDHIAVLPIIGSFDDERVFTLQEDMLFQASELELDHLIIDLSGLGTTDTHVAQELFNLFDALRLLGIQPIVSGINPSIALSLVQLGLSFGKVESFATLKQALESLY
ncbi:STAS domain-containing protein [Sporosarcina sp. G11-34]|nr:STAS domain-containing protein [Sporosarcina sp. G11-34]